MIRILLLSALLAIAVPEPAHSARSHWPGPDVIRKCSVYLPPMPEGKLKRLCLKLSKRMP